MEISTTEPGWVATGHLVEMDDAEGFAILCDLDPFFSLRFGDDSTVPVTLLPIDGDRSGFNLTE
ncbi:hypothetical protein ACI2K4_08990 [Micromonospora sp. NPDC050397]|uniref:hypothetical protein n=1 Tax=Micromonospora sp. NPDC050397 TaxID=3364279 RepID=UPI00384F9DE4